MAQKNATLRALIGQTLYDLMPKGSVYNIYVDESTTLASKLAEVITSLNGKVTPEQLEAEIASVLEEAKVSGEFDGEDGKDGTNGKDGVSPTVSVTEITGGHRITITDVNDTYAVDVMDGKDGVDGSPGTNGKDGTNGTNGKDGTSVTHTWSGTTLTITSASGTSSANLKGDTGDTGPQGPAYTLTTADKTEMVSAVIAALPVYNGEVVTV